MYKLSAIYNEQIKQEQMKTAEYSACYLWFLQIQHKMQLLMITAVSKLFKHLI